MNINLAGAGPMGQAIIERDMHSLAPTYKREYALVVDRGKGRRFGMWTAEDTLTLWPGWR
jgi:hypothetical protein